LQTELGGPGEPRSIARAEASFADFRAAQRFAIEIGALDEAFTLIASIREFAMRAMRYEVFAWADAACRAPGAQEHPLVPLLTGMRAYGAWVRGDFELAMALAGETRRLEAVLATAPSGLAERVLANILFVFEGDEDAGRRQVARQIELADESGIDSRIVHACYMGAVAAAANAEHDEARALIARARGLAQKTGSPTDLASVAVSEGFASRTEADALEAFVAADRLARSAGNRWMSSFAYTEASGLLISSGRLDEGCVGLAEILGLWYRAGDWSQQWHTLSRCVVALHRIGKVELAMELVGAIETCATLGVAPMLSNLTRVTYETRDALVAKLGEERAAELQAAGAASPVGDIVLRTRDALVTPP
jgi:hypothetical protein